MARRKRTGNRTFPKRATLWLPFEVTQVFVTAGAKVVSGDLLGNYFSQTGEEVPIGTTIGPVRWTAFVTANVTTAVDPKWRAELAMQVVREGGRAVLPSPGTDIMDAMWYGQVGDLGQKLETASGVFTGRTTQYVNETKAMRKVTGNGQELKIFGVASANTDYDIVHIGVLMLKLP